MSTLPTEGVSLSGIYKVQVVKAGTDEVVQDTGWRKNLILNGGMNAVASQYVANLNAAAICGWGTRPNFITSSTSTITQSGHIAHLYERTGLTAFTQSYSTYTSSINLGDVIKYGNGSKVSVVGIIDAWNVLVYPALEIDLANSQSFTIWKTSQADLEKEVKRTTSYTTGLGNCGTYTETPGSNVVFHKRTYTFAAETASIGYNEMGVSWTSTRGSGNTTTARVVLPATVTVGVGFQLRFVHILKTIWQPTSSVYFTASVTGWPVAPSTDTIATQSMQIFSASNLWTFCNFGTTGGVTFYSGYWTREPAGNSFWNGGITMFTSTNSNSLAPINSAVSRASGVLSEVGYGGTINQSSALSGSWGLVKYFDFGLNDSNSTSIRTMGYGWNYGGSGATSYDSTHQNFTVLFRQPQTKTNLQTMRLAWQYTWDRELND